MALIIKAIVRTPEEWFYIVPVEKMQGRIHRANIYRRVTVDGSSTWESTPFIRNYECRVDSISPTAVLREQYATCTHSAVGEPNDDIDQGMRIVMIGGDLDRDWETRL